MKPTSDGQIREVGEVPLWDLPEDWPGLAAKALKRLAPEDCDALMLMLDIP